MIVLLFFLFMIFSISPTLNINNSFPFHSLFFLFFLFKLLHIHPTHSLAHTKIKNENMWSGKKIGRDEKVEERLRIATDSDQKAKRRWKTTTARIITPLPFVTQFNSFLSFFRFWLNRTRMMVVVVEIDRRLVEIERERVFWYGGGVFF